MQQIQLAEAKNRLSEIARLAQLGETFEITVRGVPVARITPIPKQSNKAGFHHSAHGPALLLNCLREFGFSYDLCKEALLTKDGQSGKQFLSASHKLVADREYFILTLLESEWQETTIRMDQTSVTLGPWKLDVQAHEVELIMLLGPAKRRTS